MIPGLIILALTSNISLGIKIWDRKYVKSKIYYRRVRKCISYLMFNAIKGVGLVPRLNVVGVPSEARLLYVVDNNLSGVGAGDDRPVRRRRGKNMW